jgi:hypothetical protein
MRYAGVLVAFVACVVVLGVSASTASAAVTTVGPNPPRGIHLSYLNDPSTAVIAWYTASASSSRAEWGPNPGPPYPHTTSGTEFRSPGGTFLHTTTLTSLTPGTTYYYRVGDAAMASWSGEGSFRSAPAADGTGVFTLAAAGDWGDSATTQATSNAIATANPNLVLILGDLFYTSSEAGIRNVWDKWQAFGQSAFTMAVPGNHEYHDPPINVYCAFVVQPGNERTYAFTYGNAFFLAIDWGERADSMTDGVDGTPSSCAGVQGTPAIRSWIDARLAEANSDPNVHWKIVLEHHPCYQTDTAVSSSLCPDGTGAPDQVEDIFVNRGVDLVLSGHAHTYGRTHPVKFNSPTQTGSVYAEPGAPIYFTIGTAGRPTTASCRSAPYVAVCRATVLTAGYGKFVVGPSSVSYQFVENSAGVIDSFSLTKGSERGQVTRTFQKGDGGSHSETDDTYLYSGAPGSNFGSRAVMLVDGSGCIATGTVCKSLIKYPDIFGGAEDQILPRSTIDSAVLSITVTNSGGTQDVYQVTEGWGETTATWNGFAVPGSPASRPRATSFTPSATGRIDVDITTVVRDWAAGFSNQGILIASTSSNGVDYGTSESANPPKLTVRATPPPFDFFLAVNPSSGSVTPGGSVDTAVTASLLSGSPELVDFSCSGLPTGGTCSFTPQMCRPACTSAVTISTSPGTPTGTYAITISASGGSLTRPASYTLTVTSIVTVSFQKGDGGALSETDDAYIYSGARGSNFGAQTKMYVDGDGCIATGTVCKSLIKFPSFVGGNSGQVPPGSTIVSATIEFMLTNAGRTQSAQQVTEDWRESTVTWNSFATPGSPTVKPPAISYESPMGKVTVDVTLVVQRWTDGEPNFGLLITTASTNGADYDTSESANPPKLTVTYRPPPPTDMPSHPMGGHETPTQSPRSQSPSLGSSVVFRTEVADAREWSPRRQIADRDGHAGIRTPVRGSEGL